MKYYHRKIKSGKIRCRKTYRSLNSAFIKATKKKEDEVTKKLEEGNKEDHSRHEEYLLSFIDEPLKTQIYSYM